MDPIRRKILKTGVAATAMAAAPRVLAQQPGSTGTGKFFERGPFASTTRRQGPASR
jgi:hypothetical protein